MVTCLAAFLGAPGGAVAAGWEATGGDEAPQLVRNAVPNATAVATANVPCLLFRGTSLPNKRTNPTR
jgi:hypothetical protein